MTGPNGLTRRQTMLGAAAAPMITLAATLPARAGAPMLGGAAPVFSRFVLGGFEVTTLLAVNRPTENPQETFGMNVPAEEFAAVSAANFLPTDRAQSFITPTVINTGEALVLFDTSTDPGSVTAALAAAGYQPGDIDVVVLTHMHPDHIGGMTTDGAPTFANARYVTGAAEHNHWSGAGSEIFDKNVRPFADQTTMLDDGGDAVSGITAVAAFGHTPGHMAWHVESEGKRLMITADTANHHVWSLAHPDWEVRFDADKPAAAAARRKIFGMVAADRLPFIGYHMPFPATAFVEADGEGFRYVPTSYQLMIG